MTVKYKKVPLVNLWFKGSRCPWHIKTSSAVLDLGGRKVGERWEGGWRFWEDDGMGRFGGGWLCKAGVLVGKSSILIEWVFGSVWVTWVKPEEGK